MTCRSGASAFKVRRSCLAAMQRGWCQPRFLASPIRSVFRSSSPLVTAKKNEGINHSHLDTLTLVETYNRRHTTYLSMKILLTNDDGIDAPGLSALYECVLQAFGVSETQILVVAPDRGRSECSHSVTSGRPLIANEVRPGWISIDGTPVDCVRAGLTTLMPTPTMVLSGINAGANLGVNLMVSGTFAAAKEAALHAVPAMAVSHYRKPGVPKTWLHTPRWVESTLTEFAAIVQANQRLAVTKRMTPLWNVNLPAMDPETDRVPIQRCRVDECPIERVGIRNGTEISFELDFHGRPRDPGTDVDLCFAGNLTISELSPHLSKA